MGKIGFLSEFEHVVLLALARLRDDAYGMAIAQEIEERAGGEVAVGSVYSALDRLERKGYVSAWMGEPTPERGGRAKRFYRLEYGGLMALRRSRDLYARLWDGLELDPERFGRR